MATNAIYYDTEIRQQAGLSSAVIYNRIKYWCNINALNKKNIKNGIAYCYQSYYQLSQATGYSIATVKRCLRKLLKLGLIFKREKYKKTEINNFSVIDENQVQSFSQPENNTVQPENNTVQPENNTVQPENNTVQPENTETTENKKQSTPPSQNVKVWNKKLTGNALFNAIKADLAIKKYNTPNQRRLL